MKLLTTIVFLIILTSANAQKVLNVRYPAAQPFIELNAGVMIPSITAGYTLWLPKTSKPAGLIVLPHERRDSVQQTGIIKYALRSGIAIMHVSTDNPIEFLFNENKTRNIADDILRVCKNFDIPKNNLMFVGGSISGTRALKLAIFCAQTKEFESIRPKAIAICDVPLDMHRYYNSNAGQQEKSLATLTAETKFSATDYLSKNLDGTPSNSKARYASYSPYSKYVRNGGNAAYFTKIHVRGYINENVDWNSEKHGGNAYDIANFINQLSLLGSNRAEMIFSSTKDKSDNSWNIVDEKELVSWFQNIISN